MRPDGLRVMKIGLTIAGIDNIDLFHLSVIIPVVIFKLHFLGGGLTSLGHQFCGVLVELAVCKFYVTSIVLILVLGQIGAHDIEGKFKLSVTLIMEIIPDTAVDNNAIHILQTCFVGDVIPQGMGIDFLTRIVLANKLLIGELHEDNQSFSFSCELARFSHFLTSSACTMGWLTKDTFSHDGTTLLARSLGLSI